MPHPRSKSRECSCHWNSSGGEKIMRTTGKTALIEAGAVYLPTRAPWMEEFKKELLSFPESKHDDQIDALSQGLHRAFAPGSPVAQFGRYGQTRGVGY